MSNNQKEKPQEKKENLKPYQLDVIEKVCSIDFGSFGCAAAHCPKDVPKQYQVVKGSGNGAEISKNLSALLLDKDTLKVKSFGFEAEAMYAKNKKENCLMYFQHFKPHLYSQLHAVDEKDTTEKAIARNTSKNKLIYAEDGINKVELSILITKSLEETMKIALEQINHERSLATLEKLGKENIFWVISVPAIWDEMAMELMKYCAQKAGMIHFELGMEPIVAAFYVLKQPDNGDLIRKKGTKLIVLDCGGGTTDASCLRIDTKRGDLSELHHGNGIPCGGLDVDKLFLEYFEQVLKLILPNEILNIVKNGDWWLKQRNKFVKSRWNVPYEAKKGWLVELIQPISSFLNKIRKESKKNKKNAKKLGSTVYDDPFGELQKKVANFMPDNIQEKIEDLKTFDKYKNKDVGGFFELSSNTDIAIHQLGWDILHYDTVKKISNFLAELRQNDTVASVRDVILVGGFAQSQYLVRRLVKDHKEIRFLDSRTPHLAVVRGALFWICNRRDLKLHRSKWTYGIAMDRKFDPNKDDPKRKSGNMVYNAFDLFCEFNEPLLDGTRREFLYTIRAKQDKVEIPIYVTKSKNKRYIFNDGDEDVIPVKKFIIKLEPKNEKRLFTLNFEFNHNGVKLYYIHPQTKKNEYFQVELKDIDITATEFKKNDVV